jgi:hypothetical protein
MSNDDKKINDKTNNDGNFDLSGVFQVQRNYLTDLSNSYPNVNNAPLVAKYVLDLQEKVKDTTDSYKKADTSASNVLTEQNKMIDIVKNEQKRLEQKKMLIDQADQEEKRKVLLTESNQLRKAESTKIILVFIICVVIHILLFLCVKYFFESPIDPGVNTIFILLHLFNFIIWTIVAFTIYINIQSRSHINFNKLELPPPKLTPASTSPAISDYNNLFKDLGLCYSDGCCGENTYWDDKIGVCTNTPGKKSSSTDSKESFVTNTSLNISPIFIPGKTTAILNKENEMGKISISPDEAKREEEKKKNKATVKGKMNEIMGSMIPSDFNENMINSINTPTPTIETSDTGKAAASAADQALEDSIPKDTAQSKCYFTTMADATREMMSCKKVNREVYHPTSSNDLLPTSNLLNNEVYFKGLNHSKELTDRFSNYN